MTMTSSILFLSCYMKCRLTDRKYVEGFSVVLYLIAFEVEDRGQEVGEGFQPHQQVSSDYLQRRNLWLLLLTTVIRISAASVFLRGATEPGLQLPTEEDPKLPGGDGADLPLHGLISAKMAAEERKWREPDFCDSEWGPAGSSESWFLGFLLKTLGGRVCCLG